LSRLTSSALIELLGLVPLPHEGGHFRQTWVSDLVVAAGALGPRYPVAKAAGTAIYYLLTDDPDSFSALHRLPTDEVYHFYLGDPVEQVLLHPGGRTEHVVLGHDLGSGQRVQHVVPRGVWQGSRLRPGGRVALLGTTMAPGFDASDYEAGVREALLRAYPAEAEAIVALTRQPGAHAGSQGG
jgi:predicted cupin superfamily sugar epimerase